MQSAQLSSVLHPPPKEACFPPAEHICLSMLSREGMGEGPRIHLGSLLRREASGSNGKGPPRKPGLISSLFR